MKKRFLGVLALIPIIFFACKHDDEIGLGLQQGDKLNVLFSDTTTILAYTIPETPLANAGSFNLIGSYKDPVFGQTTADFYSQFQIPSNTISLGTNPGFDSIVFSMAYAGFYGDTSKAETFKVYEIDETLSKDSTYHTNKTFLTKSTAIGQITFKPRLTDSVQVEGKNRAPQIRIKMDNSFVQEMFTYLSKAGVTNASFETDFKGLKIQPDLNTGDGSILYFNLFSDQSGLTIYYHNSTGGGLKTNLTVNGTSKRVNHFDHAYPSTITAKTAPYPAKSDTVLYLQTLSGLKAKLLFPFIKNMGTAQRVVIHKAELVIPVASDNSSTTYKPSSQLYVYSTDSTGKETVTLDQFAGASYFGGSYNSTNKTYTFNLARYFQQVLNGQVKDYGLNLVTVASVVSGDRVVVIGSPKVGSKIRLKITYTKL